MRWLAFLVPAMALAAPDPAVQQLEKTAVLNSAQIAAHLKIETDHYNLKCEKMSDKDVTLTDDGTGLDAFEIVYGCNDKKVGANVVRIHFKGAAYTQSPKSTKADVVLTGMSVELPE